MKLHSRFFYEDDAAYEVALAAYKRKRDGILVSRLICDFSTIVFFFLLFYYSVYDSPPEFSVQLVAVRGLVDMPAHGASISPAFNVTLHAGNNRGRGRCYHDGEVVVSYSGFTAASGRVPCFCVPGKGHREIPFLALGDGVGLPELLRDRMVEDRRVGALQLEVEVKLFRGVDGSARPTWAWCGVRMDEVQPSPIVLSSCTVLAQQNWFSQYQQF